MSRRIERFQDLTTTTAYRVLGISASVLLAEAFLGCGLGFQPSWANGWPGLSKHSIFAAFFSGLLFLMLTTAGVALFVVPCSYLQRLTRRDYVGWATFALFLVTWAAMALFLSLRAFPTIRSDIATEWT